eukprot:GHVQ01040610.1.p1 GENE.GHVQ01040610.1~~GHVQ01040610.1.p1  ORF type:complete len:857 (+),score=196.78 GHVQ01040610.1:3-2573(+)
MPAPPSPLTIVTSPPSCSSSAPSSPILVCSLPLTSLPTTAHVVTDKVSNSLSPSIPPPSAVCNHDSTYIKPSASAHQHVSYAPPPCTRVLTDTATAAAMISHSTTSASSTSVSQPPGQPCLRTVTEEDDCCPQRLSVVSSVCAESPVSSLRRYPTAVQPEEYVDVERACVGSAKAYSLPSPRVSPRERRTTSYCLYGQQTPSQQQTPSLAVTRASCPPCCPTAPTYSLQDALQQSQQRATALASSSPPLCRDDYNSSNHDCCSASSPSAMRESLRSRVEQLRALRASVPRFIQSTRQSLSRLDSRPEDDDAPSVPSSISRLRGSSVCVVTNAAAISHIDATGSVYTPPGNYRSPHPVCDESRPTSVSLSSDSSSWSSPSSSSISFSASSSSMSYSASSSSSVQRTSEGEGCLSSGFEYASHERQEIDISRTESVTELYRESYRQYKACMSGHIRLLKQSANKDTRRSVDEECLQEQRSCVLKARESDGAKRHEGPSSGRRSVNTSTNVDCIRQMHRAQNGSSNPYSHNTRQTCGTLYSDNAQTPLRHKVTAFASSSSSSNAKTTAPIKHSSSSAMTFDASHAASSGAAFDVPPTHNTHTALSFDEQRACPLLLLCSSSSSASTDISSYSSGPQTTDSHSQVRSSSRNVLHKVNNFGCESAHGRGHQPVRETAHRKTSSSSSSPTSSSPTSSSQTSSSQTSSSPTSSLASSHQLKTHLLRHNRVISPSRTSRYQPDIMRKNNLRESSYKTFVQTSSFETQDDTVYSNKIRYTTPRDRDSKECYTSAPSDQQSVAVLNRENKKNVMTSQQQNQLHEGSMGRHISSIYAQKERSTKLIATIRTYRSTQAAASAGMFCKK